MLRRSWLAAGSSRWGRLPGAALFAAGVVSLAACIAVAPTGIHRVTAEGGGGSGGGFVLTTGTGGGGGPPANLPDSGMVDPHAVIGANPSHGPFNGGGRVLVAGNGFSSEARVWFGATEANEATSVHVDPTKVQVIAPPGVAGPVDITVQNGSDTSTKRTLVDGYTYDALYAVPNTGPVAGGTVIQILGQNTGWGSATVAKIDQTACTKLTVNSPTQLTCTVPPGTQGSKTITVTTGAESILVLDAYTYQDSTNGFTGGLSGLPLAGQMRVLVYDNYTGQPVPSAPVIVGTDITTALQAMTDATGVAVITDPSLNTPQTVTITGYCHSPVTFVAEPVDTVTAYLDPLLTPACSGMGDPPPVGGTVGAQGTVTGEIVFPDNSDLAKGPWTVPAPVGANEKQVAYLFTASSDPTQPFYLPSPSTAVTPDSPGASGYQFELTAYPGDTTIYAIAGIEDDSVSPPSFVAWVMGVIRGVPIAPSQVTSAVYVQMDHVLDQALRANVAPPPPGPNGPDRLVANLAVLLGPAGYAILPVSQDTLFLPVQGQISFVGLPGLDGDLAGSLYVASARAVTGSTESAPLSVIQSQATNNTSQVLAMTSFVSVPTLTTPASNGVWDGVHLAATYGTGNVMPDLTVYDIVAGNGVAHWLVASPGGTQAITLPSLAGFAFPGGALPSGSLNIDVYGGTIPTFDYGALTYQQLSTSGMSAYAQAYFNASM